MLVNGSIVVLPIVRLRTLAAENGVVYTATLPAGTSYNSANSIVSAGTITDNGATVELEVDMVGSIPIDSNDFEKGWELDNQQNWVIAVEITDVNAFSALSGEDRKVVVAAPGGDDDALNDIAERLITESTCVDVADCAGTVGLKFTSFEADEGTPEYTVADDDRVIFLSADGAEAVVNLPAAASAVTTVNGKTFSREIILVLVTNPAVDSFLIEPDGAETIHVPGTAAPAANWTIDSATLQGHAIRLVTDGTVWYALTGAYSI